MPWPKNVCSGESFGPIDELIYQHDVAKLVFELEATAGADTESPSPPPIFHRIKLARCSTRWQRRCLSACRARKIHLAPGHSR